jgi:cellulose biosynthesis protein BcsQ
MLVFMLGHWGRKMWLSLLSWLDSLPSDFRGHVVGGFFQVIGTIRAGVFGTIIGILFKGWIDRRKHKQLETEIDVQAKKMDSLLRKLRDAKETTLWTSFPSAPPFTNYAAAVANSLPIITIANLKGGVGKTTVAANLAACLDLRFGQRVLLIDLDYQGSLTTVMRSYLGQVNRRSLVNELISGCADFGTLFKVSAALAPALPKTRLVPAFYEFARYEDRVMIEWLLQETQDDVRYRLARVLLAEEIKSQFDIILIDAPPRLTTGTINALCASNYLIVPTIFNMLSAETVGNFLQTVKHLLLHDLNQQLNVLGVLETLAPRINEANDERAAARATIEEALQKLQLPSASIFDVNIPRRTAIAKDGLAYIRHPAARPIFDALASTVVEKINLRLWESAAE